MTHTNTIMQDVWTATLRGKPSLGDPAERSRRTNMRDVEIFPL
jgi:hypothetical protein